MSRRHSDALSAVVTYLETRAPPPSAPVQPPSGAQVVRARSPTISFYRYLYDTVGEPWMWSERRLLDDTALRSVLESPGLDLRVLWLHGVPAGFCELDLIAFPEAKIAYFGLIPEFIGRGLGRYLLDWSVRHAFAIGAVRLWVHTCDLDHPRALPLYRALGFKPYDRLKTVVTIIPGMRPPEHACRESNARQ